MQEIVTTLKSIIALEEIDIDYTIEKKEAYSMK
jgi:hypothetical protein